MGGMNQPYWNLKLPIMHQHSIGPKPLFTGWLSVINCIDEGGKER